MFNKDKDAEMNQVGEKPSNRGQEISKPKEKPKKSGRIKAFIIGVVVGSLIVVGLQLSGALSAFGFINSLTAKETTVVNNQMLINELKKIEELSTLSFKYTNYAEVNESNDINGFALPLTSHEFLLIYGGEVKLGVDMSQADVQVQGAKVSVVLPKSKILSDEIDEDSVKYYDLKNDIFNQIQWEDRQEARKELKKKTQESAQMQENLEKADENARDSVGTFCKAVLPEGYSVEVTTIE